MITELALDLDHLYVYVGRNKMFGEDTGIPVSAFILLYIIAAALWMWTSNTWIDKGMPISMFVRIMVYVLLLPVTYGVAYIWANKD